MKKIVSVIKRYPLITLGSGIAVYTMLLSAVCLFKYYQFGYNALDLAIYNNALFNAAAGNDLWSSIQGHHYFADHFEPVLYLLMPLYKLWPSAEWLLILQSLLLGLTALPVYLLSTRIINQRAGLLLGLLWLLNPLTWNINLYEWHVLPLAIPLLLLAYYFYLEKKYWPYLALLIAALLIREDVAVAVGGFFLLALLEKRPWRWWLAPAGLSAGYFLGSLYIISLFQTGGSRFNVYYHWLFAAQPSEIVWHFFSLGNIEMLLGLSLAFLFLPWFTPRPLILLAGPLLQFALGASGGSNLIVETHYSSLFIPGLIIASLWTIKNWPQKKWLISRWYDIDRSLSRLLVGVIIVYLLLFLGPGWAIGSHLTAPAQTATEQKLLARIPGDIPVAAGYRYLPWLSTRTDISSLHYIFIGSEQFSSRDYTYTEPQTIVFDPADSILYGLQFPNSSYYHPSYPDGFVRLKELIANGYGLEIGSPRLLIWQRTEGGNGLFESSHSGSRLPQHLGPLDFGYATSSVGLALRFTSAATTTPNLYLQITTERDRWRQPPQLLTPTVSWQPETVYQSILFSTEKNISLEIRELDGHIELGGWRDIVPVFSHSTIVATTTLSL